MTLHIRTAQASDAQPLVDIYNHYILHSTATFEEALINAADMAERIAVVQQAQLPWLVASNEQKFVGYAYARRWHTRSAYRFTAECTVYIAPDAHKQGYGRRLYAELIEQMRQRDFRQLLGVITLPNPASQALHEALGFEKAGQFNAVGFKFGQWLDVGYWQLSLTESH